MPAHDRLDVNRLRALLDESSDGRSLDLSSYELEDLPKALLQVPRLLRLDLSSNRLELLPDWFCQLSNLVKLELGSNRIVHLPNDFGKLRNLQYLDLFRNHLEDLPLSFGSLDKLNWLDLKGNPLDPELARAVGPCGSEAQCKAAAHATVQLMNKRRSEHQKAVEDQEKRLFEHRNNDDNESIATTVTSNQSNGNRKKNAKKGKSARPNLAEIQEEQRHNATLGKIVNDVRRHQNHDTKTRSSTNQQGGGFFWNVIRLAFWLVFFTGAVFIVELGYSCAGSPIHPSTRPFCRDLHDAWARRSWNPKLVTSFSTALTGLSEWKFRHLSRFTWSLHSTAIHYGLILQREAAGLWNSALTYARGLGLGDYLDGAWMTFRVIWEILKDVAIFFWDALKLGHSRLLQLVDLMYEEGVARTIERLFN